MGRTTVDCPRHTIARGVFAGPDTHAAPGLYSRIVRGDAKRARESLTLGSGAEVSTNTYFGRVPASYLQRWTGVAEVRADLTYETAGTLVIRLRASDCGGNERTLSTLEAAGSGTLQLATPLNAYVDGGAIWLEFTAEGAAATIAGLEWTVDGPAPAETTGDSSADNSTALEEERVAAATMAAEVDQEEADRAPGESTVSAQRSRIESRLAEHVPEVDFANAPLGRFIDFVRELGDLPILLEEASLRAAGLKPSTLPLPLASQPASVGVGMKRPVLPASEVAPASVVALTTPAVTRLWLGAATSLNDLTKVPAGVVDVAAQYCGWRRRARPLAQVMRGSQIGWYLVNSASPLSTRLPPAVTMRDQLKLWPLSVELRAGSVWPEATVVVTRTDRP